MDIRVFRLVITVLSLTKAMDMKINTLLLMSPEPSTEISHLIPEWVTGKLN